MPEIVRKSVGVWSGDLKGGKGHISTASGALAESPFTFASRFENAPATNPEELVAAAHAGCFSMFLANILASEGHTATHVRTTATLRIGLGAAGPKITSIHLECEAAVPGLDPAGFADAAARAKDGCPISKLVAPGLETLTLDARLAG